MSPEGVVLNDETIELLCRQAVVQAEAGADLIGPSDMMDGRVVPSAKPSTMPASSTWGSSATPRNTPRLTTDPSARLWIQPPAAGSKPIPKNKDTYQMDPANAREAITEAQLDEQEGADIMMVKPGLAYLDIIHRLRDESELPIAAYNVSGEYSMVKAAAERGWIDEKAVVLETLLSFKRAGADLILTYHACDAAEWLKRGRKG